MPVARRAYSTNGRTPLSLSLSSLFNELKRKPQSRSIGWQSEVITISLGAANREKEPFLASIPLFLSSFFFSRSRSFSGDFLAFSTLFFCCCCLFISPATVATTTASSTFPPLLSIDHLPNLRESVLQSSLSFLTAFLFADDRTRKNAGKEHHTVQHHHHCCPRCCCLPIIFRSIFSCSHNFMTALLPLLPPLLPSFLLLIRLQPICTQSMNLAADRPLAKLLINPMQQPHQPHQWNIMGWPAKQQPYFSKIKHSVLRD